MKSENETIRERKIERRLSIIIGLWIADKVIMLLLLELFK
tara:strand:+ start:156 stop:275 length:120 start_codon:yes stop_codon:yes gene_type:complete